MILIPSGILEYYAATTVRKIIYRMTRSVDVGKLQLFEVGGSTVM
jgi:hypothetical protein